MRGVQLVKWKNGDGTTSTKYRVQIKRKTLQLDKLFDTQAQAEECVLLAKSTAGQNLIKTLSQRDHEEREDLSDLLANPRLSYFLDKYRDKYLLQKDEREISEINASVYKSIISTIKKTRIPDRSISKKMEGVLLEGWGNPHIQFGNMKIEDIDEITINDYIEVRLKTATKQTEKKEIKKLVSKTTVKRELTIISRFFEKLRYLDNVKFKKFSFNPVEHHDKDLLEGHKQYRLKRFSDDDLESLFAALSAAKNKEMLLIFLLSLSTGLRRSEVVPLKWSQITSKTIDLGKTKNGMPRSVVLLHEAKEILGKIPRLDDRLFHYSISGFSTNWKRALKKSGVTDVRFHDCRKEFISTILESISNSSVVVAELTGSVDPDYLEKTYIKENSLDSEKGLMNSVGHGSKSMLKRYAKIIKG